jgi:hypothetical protein
MLKLKNIVSKSTDVNTLKHRHRPRVKQPFFLFPWQEVWCCSVTLGSKPVSRILQRSVFFFLFLFFFQRSTQFTEKSKRSWCFLSKKTKLWSIFVAKPWKMSPWLKKNINGSKSSKCQLLSPSSQGFRCKCYLRSLCCILVRLWVGLSWYLLAHQLHPCYTVCAGSVLGISNAESRHAVRTELAKSSISLMWQGKACVQLQNGLFDMTFSYCDPYAVRHI